jgi:hypothetical protein
MRDEQDAAPPGIIDCNARHPILPPRRRPGIQEGPGLSARPRPGPGGRVTPGRRIGGRWELFQGLWPPSPGDASDSAMESAPTQSQSRINADRYGTR